MPKEEKMSAAELHANLGQFIGGEQWFRHALARNVVYSEGMKYLAENAGAYWLIDAIASHLAANPKIKNERKKNERFARLHFWHLRKTGENSAVLEAVEDKGMKPVDSQEIEFTDFPFEPSGEDFVVYAGDDGPGTPIKLFLSSEY
jgi:hypothetical protein